MNTYYVLSENVTRMFSFLFFECEASIINVSLFGVNTELNQTYYKIESNDEHIKDSYWYNKLIWSGEPKVDELPF